MNRLEHLRIVLKARTHHDGSAMPGYEENVKAIRAEIERLEAEQTD